MKEYKLTEEQVYEITSLMIDEIDCLEDHRVRANSDNAVFHALCQRRLSVLREIIAVFEV